MSPDAGKRNTFKGGLEFWGDEKIENLVNFGVTSLSINEFWCPIVENDATSRGRPISASKTEWNTAGWSAIRGNVKSWHFQVSGKITTKPVWEPILAAILSRKLYVSYFFDTFSFLFRKTRRKFVDANPLSKRLRRSNPKSTENSWFQLTHLSRVGVYWDQLGYSLIGLL